MSESPPNPARFWRRAALVLGGLLLAVVAAIAFSAYQRPELLLDLMGLRYCG